MMTSNPFLESKLARKARTNTIFWAFVLPLLFVVVAFSTLLLFEMLFGSLHAPWWARSLTWLATLILWIVFIPALASLISSIVFLISMSSQIGRRSGDDWYDSQESPFHDEPDD